MGAELQRTLTYVLQGRLHERPHYQSLPDELLQLRHVALSGDGEPTLAPNFAEALQEVIHVRALGGFPFFKIVLITNGTALDRPQVQESLKRLTKSDEIWVKLDGGTQDYLNKVDRPQRSAGKILANILALARQRPVVIQSLFPAINERGTVAGGNRAIRAAAQGIEGPAARRFPSCKFIPPRGPCPTPNAGTCR